MRVVFRNGLFVCRCRFEDRDIPRKAGFRFTKARPYWHTETLRVAARLREYADESAKAEIDRVILKLSPWYGPLPHPSDLSLYNFQKEAARFALARNRSYLALDPGLGKTPVAAVVRNALHALTVFISPPFLARNAEAEFRKWTDDENVADGQFIQPEIVRLDTKEAPVSRPDILIVPDSVIHRAEVRLEIREVALRAKGLGLEPLLMVDEAHRFKNDDALRTKALFGFKTDDGFEPGIIADFPRQVYLSGTPLPNRPMELYPILSSVAPETIDFMSRFDYGLKYCAGHQNDFGWDFSGASNMKALAARVREKFMLRLKKNDVLTELPPKTEEIVIVGDRPAKLIKMEADVLREHSPEDLIKGTVSSAHIATYRRELGAMKVGAALDFLRSLLDDGDESLLVFAYHKEVIAGLTLGLEEYKPLVITGGTPNGERDQIVKEFQGNPRRRVFIGNYLAAGIGLTLTKATRVVFAEFSYVPAENEQASDRAHRIGQRDHVFVQYLVYENSIDRKILEANFKKRRVINQL